MVREPQSLQFPERQLTQPVCVHAKHRLCKGRQCEQQRWWVGGWIRPTLRSCGLAVASWNDDIAVSYLQWQADDVEVESGCQRNGVVKGQARGTSITSRLTA